MIKQREIYILALRGSVKLEYTKDVVLVLLF
jgi:hypothetical protein